MNDKQFIKKEVEITQQAVRDSHLLRLAGFADQVDRFIDIKLKKKINRVKVLALISLISAGGTLTPSELGRRIIRTNDNVSKLLDSLVKDGVVTRYRKGKDRRNVQIKITPYGLDLINQILDEIRDEEVFIESCLESGEYQHFEKLLRIFRVNLTQKINEV